MNIVIFDLPKVRTKSVEHSSIDERFYIGEKPCARGHTSKRYKSTGNCVECLNITRQPPLKAANRSAEAKKRSYVKQYGLTVEAYDLLVLKQDNKCAICKMTFTNKRGEYACIDHCHNSQKVRGLLCFNCNCGIGLLKDSPELLLVAHTYLTNE